MNNQRASYNGVRRGTSDNSSTGLTKEYRPEPQTKVTVQNPRQATPSPRGHA